ncbi:hypothetical protein EMIT048CA2_20068 [Pseudomonas chlororaphis]
MRIATDGKPFGWSGGTDSRCWKRSFGANCNRYTIRTTIESLILLGAYNNPFFKRRIYWLICFNRCWSLTNFHAITAERSKNIPIETIEINTTHCLTGIACNYL